MCLAKELDSSIISIQLDISSMEAHLNPQLRMLKMHCSTPFENENIRHLIHGISFPTTGLVLVLLLLFVTSLTVGMK